MHFEDVKGLTLSLLAGSSRFITS